MFSIFYGYGLRQGGSEGAKVSALREGFCIALRATGTSLHPRHLSLGPIIRELRSSNGAVARRLVDFTLRIGGENSSD